MAGPTIPRNCLNCNKLFFIFPWQEKEGRGKYCGPDCAKTRPPHSRHGYVGTRTYRIWKAMRERCRSPGSAAFKDYGKRGISVCKRWQTFENFLADMGECPEGLTIERKDNDKGYEPGNCEWATRMAQNRNKRNNRVITLNGVTHCLAEWSEITGIHQATLSTRLLDGWTEEETLTIAPGTVRRFQKRPQGQPLVTVSR